MYECTRDHRSTSAAFESDCGLAPSSIPALGQFSRKNAPQILVPGFVVLTNEVLLQFSGAVNHFLSVFKKIIFPDILGFAVSECHPRRKAVRPQMPRLRICLPKPNSVRP